MDDWSYLKPRAAFVPREVIFDLAIDLAMRIPGNLIEFGVGEGQSTRMIIESLKSRAPADASAPIRQFFGCDSFKGLPEKFEKLEIGHFAGPPPQIDGVELIHGYFADSLTPELAERVGPVAFASLDADLYSSTKCALDWLTPLLANGSLLLFDEFLGEHESEKRAFEDWSRETGTRTIRIAEFMRNPSGYGSRVDLRPLFQVISD